MYTALNDPWEPFVPTPEQPWDLRKAAHLHRRAGFGATRTELLRDVADGPAASVDRLLSPPAEPSTARMADEALRATARINSNITLLRAAWLNRIVFGADPLREKLTLFWHGHFATSVKKVKSVAFMDGQIESLRAHALGGLAPLFNAMVTDPAMLIWLDGVENVKTRPNENLAREYLELFTMGVGRYTEADVRAVARAFTGWKRDGRDGDFGARLVHRDPSTFDDGPKTLLGQSGAWGPADVVRITLDRPETTERLARKLYRFFVSELDEPTREQIEILAADLRRPDDAIRTAVGRMLRSRHFYSSKAYRQRIKSPVEFSAGMVRMLEPPRGRLNPLALGLACEGQGQELFAPPNVAGWDGGKTWLNSATLLERGNWAADFVWGRTETGVPPFDIDAWMESHQIPPSRVGQALIDLLVQDDLGPEARALILHAAEGPSADDRRETLQLVLNSAPFQLA